MKNIKKTFATLCVAIFGSALVMNCEPDVDSLGEQLFLDDAAQGKETAFDVVAFNIDNKDSIQSDASKIDSSAVLGVLSDSHFGMQKASYLTQVKLSAYNPDFGTNAIVDSVVLVIKPFYKSDSVKTTTNELYVHPDGNIDAKKVVNTYPVSKFGKENTPKLTLKVHEVLDFLNGPTDYVSSNATYNLNPNELGSKEFNGKVSSVAITKNADGSTIFSSETGIRIPLSPTFFQDKIIAKKGQPELRDPSNFIRHFRGLRISVAENDGYFMRFGPDNVDMIMYYKSDETDNGTTTRTQKAYAFLMNTISTVEPTTVHIGQYTYNRAGTSVQNALSSINTTSGDTRLYAQGMGGPSIGVKFPESTINALKSLYQNEKAAIVGAKVRIYTAPEWDNAYYKPTAFTMLDRSLEGSKEKLAFTQDLVKLSGATNFRLYRSYNLDKDDSYYEFTVTQTLKDIIESGADFKDRFIKIDVARFQVGSNGAYLGYNKNSRAYSTARAIFVGNEANNKNKIQLLVTYGTK